MVPNYTRRRMLTALATGSALALGRAATGVAAQEESVDIYLGGVTGGWEGRIPSALDGTENPTLTLREGETYVLAWENVDAAPHNVVVEDPEGNKFVETEIISDRGRVQYVEFTAERGMTRYYCQVHPGSMEGSVEVVPADSAEGIDPATDATVTPAPTPTPTPTATPSPTPTATPTPAPTATPTPTPTETDGNGDTATDTSSGGGPGLGVLAGLAGLLGAAGALARRRSGD